MADKRRSHEAAFSKIKGFLRRAKARSKEALLEAMGRALKTATAQDANAGLGIAATEQPSVNVKDALISSNPRPIIA